MELSILRDEELHLLLDGMRENDGSRLCRHLESLLISEQLRRCHAELGRLTSPVELSLPLMTLEELETELAVGARTIDVFQKAFQASQGAQALGIVIATNFIEAVMTMLRRQADAMTVIH